MVSVGRGILGRLPHVHEAYEQHQVVDTPDALVHASFHPPSAVLQPLVLPQVLDVRIVDEIAEQDERSGRHHHADEQECVESDEHCQLRVLLVLPQVVHRVHEAVEDPEVHQRIQSTMKAEPCTHPAVMYTRRLFTSGEMDCCRESRESKRFTPK